MQRGSLSEAVGRPLKWSKPNPQRKEFELRDAEMSFATLNWPGSGGQAVGETREGRWRLTRAGAKSPLDVKGALQPRIVVQPDGGGDAYEVAPGFAESVTFGGSSYRWQLNADSRVARWADDAGNVLLTIRYSPGAADAEVVLEPDASAVADLPLLVLLGWYTLRNGVG
jgi:hypothetical protein